MRNLALSGMFLLLVSPGLRAGTVALADGETLKYRVSWGILSHAGEISVTARAEELAGLPQLRVSTLTATTGVARKLYKFEARGECLYDSADGRLLAAITNSIARKKKSHAMAVFDYGAGTMDYRDYIRPEKSGTHAIPEGSVTDLITCLVQTRSWDMKTGDRRPATVMFDDDFYDLTIVAGGIEKVGTPWGEVDAMVLAPIMEKEPKGMFKRGGKVRVWISQDKRRLPVKLEISIKVGTGTAHLTDYTPPAAAGLVSASK
ncbi:MAG: DUF3108 domain-containing protein [Opitutaceae bacterium]|jgi:hypothetical protein|nr:DUF3108 domain-containing protein [Opitutaceae bacterium]